MHRETRFAAVQDRLQKQVMGSSSFAVVEAVEVRAVEYSADLLKSFHQ